MIKSLTINVYILVFLFILASHEFFSYDEERVVAFCILTFVFLTFINIRVSVYNNLKLESIFYKKSLLKISIFKNRFLKRLRYYWRIFLDIEDFVMYIYHSIKDKMINFLYKRNLKRKNFFLLCIKDDINSILGDYVNIYKVLIINYKSLFINDFEKGFVLSNAFSSKSKYLFGYNFFSNVLKIKFFDYNSAGYFYYLISNNIIK